MNRPCSGAQDRLLCNTHVELHIYDMHYDLENMGVGVATGNCFFQLDSCRVTCLQPKMVYELTAVILNQIVSGRKSVLEAYGEIVFKAWRAASGSCLERIETHLIQNVSEMLHWITSSR